MNGSLACKIKRTFRLGFEQLGQAQASQGKGGVAHESAAIQELASEGGNVFWIHGCLWGSTSWKKGKFVGIDKAATDNVESVLTGNGSAGFEFSFAGLPGQKQLECFFYRILQLISGFANGSLCNEFRLLDDEGAIQKIESLKWCC